MEDGDATSSLGRDIGIFCFVPSGVVNPLKTGKRGARWRCVAEGILVEVMSKRSGHCLYETVEF